MKHILGFLLGRWFLSFIGAAALALLFWFLGPLLAWLEPVLVRLIGVGLILLVWLAVNLWIGHRRQRAEQAMVKQIASPQDQADQAAAEEVALLRGRLEEALGALRRSSRGQARGSRFLYELPWYVLVGPPGSGKTTALRNSGLGFPLTDKLGRDAVKGVGGTRNCDWWLSEEAVLLDTAGRYTTQDSDQAVDHKAWTGFLGLLKTYRPRQPINGALVAIGLADVAGMTEGERQAHARAIRARLNELRATLGVKFPVYVLFTKLDLIAGFVEYFEDLDKDGRDQVWGTTFPLDREGDQTKALAGFEADFDALVERLNRRLIARLNDERDAERRALIFGFPTQIASLRQPILEFLRLAFGASRFEEQVLLRGVYLTSATQEGTPIDRLMSALGQNFGLERQRLAAFGGAGRGYFLGRLFRNVVVAEASLVSTDPRLERRRIWRQRLAYGAVAAAVVVLGGLWSWSYLGNRALIAQVEAETARYAAAVKPLDQRIVGDDDLGRVLPVLDEARALPTGYAARQAGTPLGLRFGLYQGDKLGSQAELAYEHALNGLLLPRLIVGVHNRLAANLDKPELSNVLLEVYLMLGRQGPMEPDLVKRTVDAIWGGRNYPGLDPVAARADLAAHLDVLLALPPDAIPLDAELIRQARAVVSRVPLAARAYRAILESNAAQALPPWRLADHAGPAADQVFRRASGRPLADPIPGIYTRDGYQSVALVQAPAKIREIAQQTWVLGPDNTVSVTPDKLPALIDDTLNLYFQDYIRQWDDLLGDLRIVPMTSLNGAIDVVNTLSGPVSPLRKLLVDAAAQTTLVAPPASAGNPAAAAANAAAGLGSTAERALGALAAGGGGGAGRPPLGSVVDDHFKALHDLVANAAAGQSQLDDVIKKLAALYSALADRAANPGAALAGGGGGGGGGAASLAASQLAQAGSRLPAPLGDMVTSVAKGSTTISTGDTRKAISDLYLSTVLPLCRDALGGRYPFERSSAIDVSLGDFTTLFRPGGVIDGFVTQNLKPYIDASVSPWRNQKVDNVDLGLSRTTLDQLERARNIRDAFFPAGAGTPTAPVTIQPVSLANEASQVVLELDGAPALTYAHGPIVPFSAAWPTAGSNRARLAMTPVSGGDTPSIVTEGPWAFFRLLDRATIEGSLPDQFTATFSVGSLSARFQLRAASVRNPLRGVGLDRFRCPEGL